MHLKDNGTRVIAYWHVKYNEQSKIMMFKTYANTKLDLNYVNIEL